MPKNVGYELADGSWSSDYKIGDKFVVVGGDHAAHNFIGKVMIFTEDDGSSCPEFNNIDYEDWYCLEAYKQPDSKNPPDFIERDTIVNLEVTGEELALLRLIIGATNGELTTSLYRKLIKFKQLSEPDVFSRVQLPIIDCMSRQFNIEKCLNEIFKEPETENEKSIREAKDEIEKAKKALEDAERELGELTKL